MAFLQNFQLVLHVVMLSKIRDKILLIMLCCFQDNSNCFRSSICCFIKYFFKFIRPKHGLKTTKIKLKIKDLLPQRFVINTSWFFRKKNSFSFNNNLITIKLM